MAYTIRPYGTKSARRYEALGEGRFRVWRAGGFGRSRRRHAIWFCGGAMKRVSFSDYPNGGALIKEGS